MKKGFTLLEVILAIFILTLATGGSSILVRQTIQSVSIVQSKLTASYLAQEGIEIVRNIRDSNWLEQRVDNVSWKEGLIQGEWEADYTTTSFNEDCEDNYNCRTYGNYLRLPVNGGFYNYTLGNETIFKRKIAILDQDIDKIMVAVEVSWQEREIPYKVEVVEYLYNWDGYK